ncbi:MAG: hypothetical protein AAFR05_12370 [Bacteroidota bacterium]
MSLSLDLVEASPVRLQLINQLGQVIRQENLGLQEAGLLQLDMELADLPNGNYHLSIQTAQRVSTEVLMLNKP